MPLEARSQDEALQLIDQEVAAARQDLDEAVREVMRDVGRKIDQVEEQLSPARLLDEHPLTASCSAAAIGFLYGESRVRPFFETFAIGVALGYLIGMRRGGKTTVHARGGKSEIEIDYESGERYSEE
jgi:hypothetical protein